MTIADWLMILAVLLGPIIAVRLTRYLDTKKEERERKLSVFKTLMATRAYTDSALCRGTHWETSLLASTMMVRSPDCVMKGDPGYVAAYVLKTACGPLC